MNQDPLSTIFLRMSRDKIKLTDAAINIRENQSKIILSITIIEPDLNYHFHSCRQIRKFATANNDTTV